LVETLGGPAIPALGFALGVERLALLVDPGTAHRPRPLATVVHQGAGTLDAALTLRRELQAQGAWVDIDYSARSFKAQFRSADRAGARFALVLGEDEVARGTVTVKDLARGEQEVLPRLEAIARVLRAAASREEG
jgi:histidyl-tRNA synthetase